MTFSTYGDLNQKMIEHFQKGEFQQARDLIETEGVNFPANRPMVDYWKMCSAARLGDTARVFEVAHNLHTDNIWYGEMLWRLTPSFKNLQGDSQFEKLVAESQRLKEQDEPNSEPVILQLAPEQISDQAPLMIALHGNQTSAGGTLPFWRGAVNAGVFLVVPQSTQPIFKGAYIWDELETSFGQIRAVYESFKGKQLHRLILAGHSMGGLVAIQMALTGELPVYGLIVTGPALPFEDAPEELEKALSSAKERGLRTYFIVGEKDTDIDQDAIRALVEKMKSAGISCELEIVPGVTHDYDPEYDAALQRALQFIIHGA